MRNNEYNLFESDKKKKPSFAEWTMQNGVNLNQTTPKPLTLGEVAPKATERVTSSASTTTKPQTRDPFLEGFYSTDDKPETERKTYLQHRTPAVDRVSPETKKPEPVKLPYRPSVQGKPKITKLPYIPAKDGAPKMTQYKNDSAKPYGSPVKIVGDNVTQKDYEDFWNAFRNEGTGDKLNWVNNQLKTREQARKTTDPFLEGFTGESKQSQNKPKNQDAIEFGENSETYKILQDLSSRWYETSDPAEKDRLHGVAEEVRMYHRQGTPIVDRHDAIMGLLHENKKIAQDYQKTMTEGLPGFLYRMSDGNYMLDSSTYLIGMVNKGEWDYKYNDDWQVKYDYFAGKDMDAPECNYRNWIPWMYFDGHLISADKLGNMNMAYVGKNMGLPEWVYKNITTTDKDDAEWVQYGIDLANSGR